MNNQLEDTGSKNKPLLIVLLGPTAVGKTKFSLALAKQFYCEIISGDSMQVYRQMDIGTAKATPEERALIPHHLLDIKAPDAPFSVAEFQQLASREIEHITDRGSIPLIVGGTGLYIESLCYGFTLNPIGSDEVYRRELADQAITFGAQSLHDQLQSVDPAAAARIHVNDQRRVIRALEVHHLTGEPFSEQLRTEEKESPYDLCLIGLTMDRAMLYNRIEERIELMIRQGLVDEIKSLMSQGYSLDHVAMQALGYKEIIRFIQGEYDWDTAVYLLKRDTRRYAKRQLSWFRRMDNVQWLDVTLSEHFDAHLATMSGIIQKKLLARINK